MIKKIMYWACFTPSIIITTVVLLIGWLAKMLSNNFEAISDACDWFFRKTERYIRDNYFSHPQDDERIFNLEKTIYKLKEKLKEK